MHQNKTIRTKPLGTLESIYLTLAGWRDGRNKFVKCDEAQTWTSAFLRRDGSVSEELEARTWSELQRDPRARYAGIPARVAMVDEKLRAWEEVRACLDALENSVFCQTRKKGEAGISDAQGPARRQREADAAKSETHTGEEQAHDDYIVARLQIASAVSDIENRETAAKLRCLNAEERTQCRITAYWRSLQTGS